MLFRSRQIDSASLVSRIYYSYRYGMGSVNGSFGHYCSSSSDLLLDNSASHRYRSYLGGDQGMSVNNKVIERAILSHLSPGFGGTRIPDWMKFWLEKGLGGVTLFSSNCPSIEETANLIAELRRYTPHVIKIGRAHV